jgi:hypothetical protein
MTAFGAAGLVVLLLGAALFVYFEPLRIGTSGDNHVTVTAVRPYDAESRKAGGKDERKFKPTQIPAAVVDWSGVEPGLPVRASWFADDTAEVSAVGPDRAGVMPRAIPLTESAGGTIPAGTYVFVAGRWQGGRVVEVLARVTIEVTAS